MLSLFSRFTSLVSSMLYVPCDSLFPVHWLTSSLDAHAIYLLNLLLAFLQPRFDPSLEADLTADEIEEGGPDEYVLPSQQPKDDEFRPFIRRLPEWNFWQVIRVTCHFASNSLGYLGYRPLGLPLLRYFVQCSKYLTYRCTGQFLSDISWLSLP